MSISRINMAIVFLVVGFPSLARACNGVEAEEGIKWCKLQCDVQHSNAQCDASGGMATYAREGDVLGIRNRFGECHSGDDPKEFAQRQNVEDCYLTNKPELIRRACNVYGGCGGSDTTKPPPINAKSIDFNVPMKPASDKQIVIADFELDPSVLPTGVYNNVTLNLTKDGKNVFDLSTYAVNFDRQDGKFHLKITTYDKSVPDVSKHIYSVAGTLTVSPP